MIELETKVFVLDGTAPQRNSSGDPLALKMVAKRYRVALSMTPPRTHSNGQDDDSFTLLFAHGVGAHKEQWEPTIETMFNLAYSRTTRSKVRIREAWSFDWQSHGDAAILNKEALKCRQGRVVSIYEWSSAISAFMTTEYMEGHNIVLVGHSAGAGAVMLTVKDFPLWAPPMKAIILVEPTIMTKEQFEAIIEDRMFGMNRSVKMTIKRRQTWPTREDAFAWFSKKYPGTHMDPRVLRTFVDYGLQQTQGGVELKCDRLQEAASYPDVEGHFEAATLIPKVCNNLPIHFIWGSKPSYLPDDIRASMSDGSYGYAVSSARVVQDAGHMVVQEKPEEVAEAILEMLSETATSKRVHWQARL